MDATQKYKKIGLSLKIFEPFLKYPAKRSEETNNLKPFLQPDEHERERESERYRIGCGIRFVEKCGLSEIADIEGPLVPENVEIVLMILVSKN